MKASDYNIERDIMLSIPSGRVPYSSSINKFGGGFESAANTRSDVWDNGTTNPVYDFPTTATITHIRAAVDSVTTHGISIELQGLDANWNLVVQTKTLDATDSTTEVELDTPLIRIFRKKVLSNVVADQDIWSGATGMVVATVTSLIQAGNNQTLMAIYTVPNGKTAYLTNFYASNSNEIAANKTPATTTIQLWAANRAKTQEFQLKHAVSINTNNSGTGHNPRPYVRFTQKTDIKLTSTCITEAGYVHGGFDLILLDN